VTRVFKRAPMSTGAPNKARGRRRRRRRRIYSYSMIL
jgi:hypothetical protein